MPPGSSRKWSIPVSMPSEITSHGAAGSEKTYASIQSDGPGRESNTTSAEESRFNKVIAYVGIALHLAGSLAIGLVAYSHEHFYNAVLRDDWLPFVVMFLLGLAALLPVQRRLPRESVTGTLFPLLFSIGGVVAACFLHIHLIMACLICTIIAGLFGRPGPTIFLLAVFYAVNSLVVCVLTCLLNMNHI